MRILFISQLFDPENAIKGLAFARALRELGHEVEVITAFPSYPGGKIYPGYRQRWRQVEEYDGIRVVRVPTYVSHGQSALRRLLSYASFAAMAGWHALFSSRRADVIYAYYPPVMVGIAAMLVGCVRRTPYVYDVQDLWPEALVGTGSLKANSLIVRLIERTCLYIYRRAARIVVLSDGYRKALIDKDVPAEKVVRIFNWCDESRMQLTVRTPEGWQRQPGVFYVLYAGNLGAAQALEHVVEAAAELSRRQVRNVRVTFLGAGVERERLEALVRELGLDNVEFLPRVPVDQVGDYLAVADALLVHLADDPVFDITIPQKTQAYLLAGRPIVMAVRGEAGALVKAAEAGVSTPPCQPRALADALEACSRMDEGERARMASNGRRFYERNMSMQQGVGRIDKLLREVVEA